MTGVPTTFQLQPSVLKEKAAFSWPSNLTLRCTEVPSNGTDAIVVRVAPTPSLRFVALVNDASSIALPASVRVIANVTLNAGVEWRMSPAASPPPWASKAISVSASKRFRSMRWSAMPLYAVTLLTSPSRVLMRRKPGLSDSDQLAPDVSGVVWKNHCGPSAVDEKSSLRWISEAVTGRSGPSLIRVGFLPFLGRHQPSSVHMTGSRHMF